MQGCLSSGWVERRSFADEEYLRRWNFFLEILLGFSAIAIQNMCVDRSPPNYFCGMIRSVVVTSSASARTKAAERRYIGFCAMPAVKTECADDSTETGDLARLIAYFGRHTDQCHCKEFCFIFGSIIIHQSFNAGDDLSSTNHNIQDRRW
jgi:hypothetical protein